MMGPWRFFGGWMWIFPLIMLCILVVVAIILVRRYGGLQNALNAIFSKMPMQSAPGAASNEQQSETALDILKKRYAKGDITQEQFEEMKKNLQETLKQSYNKADEPDGSYFVPVC